jgi:hypothetical protein
MPIPHKPLVQWAVVLWDDVNFGGAKRTVIEDVFDLGGIEFLGTSAIGIHVKPDFPRPQGGIEGFSFFDKPGWKGRELLLAPGIYPDLVALNFNDQIRSFRSAGFTSRQAGLYGPDGQITVELSPNPPQAAPLGPVPIVVDLWASEIDNLTTGPDGAPVRTLTPTLTLIEGTSSLGPTYGQQWNDRTSGVVVFRTPEFNTEYARLYAEAQPFDSSPGNGKEIGGWMDFAPGTYPSMHNLIFDKVISGFEVVDPHQLIRPQPFTTPRLFHPSLMAQPFAKKASA